MTEFGEMIKEALLGEEPLEMHPAKETLERSVRKFEKRMRTVRFMAMFAVTFMSIVAVWVGVVFARAPEDTSTKTLLIYVAVFFWAFSVIGFGKMWFAMMQNDIGIRKEIKRMEVLLLELREETRARPGGDR